jgi:hypothetical protein
METSCLREVGCTTYNHMALRQDIYFLGLLFPSSAVILDV